MNIQNTPFPILSTSRLLLRQLAVNDKYEIADLRSNEQVNKYIYRSGTVTVEEAEAFINNINKSLKENDTVYWAIALKEDNKLIGTTCFWNLVPEKELAEIGYELSPAYHGKGFAQEAIESVIKYGFDEMRLKIITALPSAENEKSVALLKRNGFILDTTYQYVSKEDAGEQAVYVRVNENY